MTANDFVYWLQGFLEVAKPETISAEQIQEIKNHIGLVLTKVTPIVEKNKLPWILQHPPTGNTNIEFSPVWLHNTSC